jgi:uncharacterized integral membrane protein (TIGR00698 family)
MNSLPPAPAAPRRWTARAGAAWQLGQRLAPGTALAGLIAIAATSISSLHGGPQLLYALLFGVAFNYLSHEYRTKPGIEFAGRAVLRLGVGLLGARITASQIAGLGWETALTVIAATATTLLCGLAVGKRLGLTRAQRVLSGGAVGICGASAALAISAVLPREKEGDRFTLMVVVTVTVLSTLAMILYPLLARQLQLPPELAGLFLGATIHDVAQVVGAGYMLDAQTGDVATIVKLFRISLLTLVVVIVSAAFKSAREQALAAAMPGRTAKPQALVPWFLWLFIAMVVLNSLGAVPPAAQAGFNDVSRGCLVVAIAALGMKTSFSELARAGWRPLVLIVVETLWIAAFVLAVILARH